MNGFTISRTETMKYGKINGRMVQCVKYLTDNSSLLCRTVTPPTPAGVARNGTITHSTALCRLHLIQNQTLLLTAGALTK